MCFKLILNWFFPWRISDQLFEQAMAEFKNYQDSQQQGDLDAALTCFEAAYHAGNDSYNNRPFVLINYASAINEYSSRFGDGKRDKVIELLLLAKDLWEMNGPYHSGYTTVLVNLANAYTTQYRRTREKHNVDEACRLYRSVLDLDVGDKVRRDALLGLGTALWTACDISPRVGDSPHLEDAIKCLDRAITLASDDPYRQALCFLNRASAYDLRYQRDTRPGDLDNAIHDNNQAVKRMHASSHHYNHIVYNLSRQYWTRYEKQTHNSKDLEMAATVMDRLIEANVILPEFGQKINELKALIVRQQSGLESA